MAVTGSKRRDPPSRARHSGAVDPIAPPRPGSTAEQTVARLHPSARWLVLPCALVVVVSGAAAHAFALVDGQWQRLALVAIAVGLVVVLGIVPFLLWASRVYLITTRRIVATRGLLARERRELMHSRANRLQLTRSPLQRLAGTGDIVISQGEREVFRLLDVPGAALVEEALLDLMEFSGGSTLARGRQPEETRRPFDPPVR